MYEPRRRTVLIGLAAVVLVAGCGSHDRGDDESAEPRLLTGVEAEALALARYRLYQEGDVGVAMRWPGPGDEDTILDVTLDLHAHRGFGSMRWATDAGDPVERLIGWSPSTIATAPAVPDGSAAPPRSAWSTRALSTGAPQDLFLSLALALGSDRPENPVLVRQGAARFLRRDVLAGKAVSVFSGPRPAAERTDSESRTRYWLDDGGDLQRFEAYLGDASGRMAQITRAGGAPDVRGLAARVAGVLRIGAADRAQ